MQTLFKEARAAPRARGRSARRGRQVSEVPRLFKLDIDAAFRRTPLRPEHRELLRVIFWHNGEITAHSHCACPFGAGKPRASDAGGAGPSVSRSRKRTQLGAHRRSHLRDSTPCAIRGVTSLRGRHVWRREARRGANRAAGQRSSCRRLAVAREVEHLLDCIARIVRCLLGYSALADEKMSCAVPLGILGLRVDLSAEGMTCVPLPDKVTKWTARIQAALDSGNLRAGAATLSRHLGAAARAARGR